MVPQEKGGLGPLTAGCYCQLTEGWNVSVRGRGVHNTEGTG